MAAQTAKRQRQRFDGFPAGLRLAGVVVVGCRKNVYGGAVRGGGVEEIPVPSARLAIQALEPQPGAKETVQP